MSRSRKWLIALAPPAARLPPTKTTKVVIGLGNPSEARNNPPKAVTRSRDMILGLVSAIYPLIMCSDFLYSHIAIKDAFGKRSFN